MPNSAAWPRTALTSCVRCRTSNSRAESTIAVGLLLRRPSPVRSAYPGRDCRVTNGLSIIAVVLAAPDEWLDVLRRDQLHRMAQRCDQPTTPVVRSAAGLQCHERWRQFGKKGFEISCPSDDCGARAVFSSRSNAMQREDSFGRIKANALKVHKDGPSGSGVDNQTLAQDAAGPSTPTIIGGLCPRSLQRT